MSEDSKKLFGIIDGRTPVSLALVVVLISGVLWLANMSEKIVEVNVKLQQTQNVVNDVRQDLNQIRIENANLKEKFSNIETELKSNLSNVEAKVDLLLQNLEIQSF